MKTISKKLFASTFLTISMFLSFSQANLGFKAGLNLNSIKTAYTDGNFYPEPRFGYHFGLMLDVAPSKRIGFQPGLLLTTKGFTDDLGQGESIQYNLTYLEVPLNLRVTLFRRLFLSMGPYVARGIGGSLDVKINSGQIYVEDVKFGSRVVSLSETIDEGDLPIRAFDFGANFGLGYTFQNIQIHLSYGMGVQNITVDILDDMRNEVLSAEDSKAYNQSGLLSISYFLR